MTAVNFPLLPPGLMPQGLVTIGGSGPVINPLAMAWKVAVVAAGGTVSDAKLLAVSNYIGALQSGSIFSVLDYLWLLGPESPSIVQQAEIDIVALAAGSLANSPTLSVKGVTGNAVNSFFTTTFVPNASAHYGLNAGCLFQYVQALDGVTGLAVSGAYDGVTGEATLFSPFSDTNFYPRINDAGPAAGGPFSTGFFVGDRSGGVVTGAHNGVDLTPNTVSVTAAPGVPVFVGCENNNGVGISSPSASTFGIYGAGGTLGATKRAALWMATEAYLTAIGGL